MRGKRLERLENIQDLKVNDWIQIEDSRLIHYGYIKKVNYSSFDAYITKVYSKEYKEEKAIGNPHYDDLVLYRNYKVYKQPEVSINEVEDKTTLIDLALLTKDETWFKELIG